MAVFDRIGSADYEQVVFNQDRASGLRSIIAIHSTRLGPALGGTRFYPYPSEDAALEDALRLAAAMTAKSALAGLDLGGGKAVILGDPRRDKSEALIRAHGRFIESLGGRYITAEDVGTTQSDMDLISRETRFVTGVSPSLGGSGDPSLATALGLSCALGSLSSWLWGSPTLAGRHVAVSGVGKVGAALVSHLVEAGARVTISDVDPDAVARVRKRHEVAVAPPEKVHAVECDFFSPCALGAVLSPATIPELRCRAVAGAANNQLAEPGCARLLADAGVLYAPDFLVNAGGIVNVAEELLGYHPGRAEQRIRRIAETTLEVLERADREGLLPVEAATRLAAERIESVGRLSLLRPGHALSMPGGSHGPRSSR